MTQIINTIKVGRKADDLTDKKFGKLTPIEIVKRNRNGVYWLCECDCGNDTIVLAKHLKNGGSKSCGCYRDDLLNQKAIDIKGKRFGKLLVLRRVEPPKDVKIKNRIYWLCKCDCGKNKVILGLNLRKGYTTSCGCYRNSTLDERKLSRL